MGSSARTTAAVIAYVRSSHRAEQARLTIQHPSHHGQHRLGAPFVSQDRLLLTGFQLPHSHSFPSGAENRRGHLLHPHHRPYFLREQQRRQSNSASFLGSE